MNRSCKKIIPLFFALLMIFSTGLSGLSIFAQGEGAIKVTGAKEGESYGLYRIFDLTYQAGDKSKSVSYTINPQWTDFFIGSEAPGKDYLLDRDESGTLNSIVVGGSLKYINITQTNVQAFAKAALAYLPKVSKVAEQRATGSEVNITGLDLGYYLIHPQGATKPKNGQGSIVSLTSTLPKATVQPKGDYPTVNKIVDKKSQDIGKTVTFTINGEVPDRTGYTKYDYILEDSLSKGLKLLPSTVKVMVGSEDVTSQVHVDTSQSQKLLVTMDMIKLNKPVGEKISLTYDVEITKEANMGNQGNPNKVVLKYSNDPKNTESKEESPVPEVRVYTGIIRVVKHEKGKEDKFLAGAEFALKNSQGKYYRLEEGTKKVTWVDRLDQATKKETSQDGQVVFEGLKSGSYSLEETKAPAGYNKLTQEVTISLTDGSQGTQVTMEAESKVANSTGGELPPTGGVGTRLFALVGGAIILYALGHLARDKFKVQRR